MKTQDKIYVPIIDMGVEEGGEQMSAIWWNRDKSAEHPEHKGVIEYVRKDAIMEMLKQEKENTAIGICKYDKGEENGRMDIINSLIDKINSL